MPELRICPSGWYPFGTHAGWDVVPRLQFSQETDEVGTPLWERPWMFDDMDELIEHEWSHPELLWIEGARWVQGRIRLNMIGFRGNDA